MEKELQANDLLMVTKIDRLEFLKLQDILFKKNITFVALDLPNSIDLATSGIAEFEKKQGIRAAQKQGKYKGRKTVINQTLIHKVKNLKENSNLSVTEIARVLQFIKF